MKKKLINTNVRKRKPYFKVVSCGMNNELFREEVHISCGNNCKVILIKTDQGFIINVFDHNDDLVESNTIWEDDLNCSCDEGGIVKENFN